MLFTDAFKPPTDNLYKFIAVSGLVFGIACLASLIYLIGTSVDASVEVKQSLRTAYAELLGNEAAVEALNAAMANYEVGDNLGELIDQVREADGESPDIQSVVLLLQSFDQFNADRSMLDTYQDYIAGGTAWSIFISFFSFIAWYWRLQRYEDRIIKLKAQAFEIQSEKQRDRTRKVTMKLPRRLRGSR
ncbi:MAG: hypothetical protein AAFY08_03460 [Planctomycetota bacterium]